jgi:anti-sigma-K factor RskA
MSTGHDEQALAASYVVGALDSGERRAFEAHLATCPICTDEVRTLGRVADALGRAVPQIAPAPALRARVLQAATGGRSVDAVTVSPRSVDASWLPLAASIVVTAGLAVYAWLLHDRIALLETRVENAERRAMIAERATIEVRRVADDAQAAMAVLSAPDLVRVDLGGQKPAPQATGRALWSRNRGMVFLSNGLPSVPTGRVYQVWVLVKGAPISAGLLPTDAAGRGTAFFQTPADIPAPTGVAVSLEPEGGVPQPTGDIFLVGAPAP